MATTRPYSFDALGSFTFPCVTDVRGTSRHWQLRQRMQVHSLRKRLPTIALSCRRHCHCPRFAFLDCGSSRTTRDTKGSETNWEPCGSEQARQCCRRVVEGCKKKMGFRGRSTRRRRGFRMGLQLLVILILPVARAGGGAVIGGAAGMAPATGSSGRRTRTGGGPAANCHLFNAGSSSGC